MVVHESDVNADDRAIAMESCQRVLIATFELRIERRVVVRWS
jgi:hypothetical protein